MKRYEGKLIIDKLGERGDGLAADTEEALWGRGGGNSGKEGTSRRGMEGGYYRLKGEVSVGRNTLNILLT